MCVCVFLMQRKKGCECLGPEGGKADDLIERSKVEQSMALRKPQTVWRCTASVGAQNITAGSREKQIYVICLFLCIICVFFFR